MKKLVYVPISLGSKIHDELKKKGVNKPFNVRHNGDEVTIELSDDWTDAEKEQLKGIMKPLFAEKKLVKEEVT